MNSSRPIASREVPSVRELALDLCLRGDAGVVGAEDPLRALAAHPVVADQGVLDVLFSACPMCRTPVTFGGGMAIE